MIAEAPQKVLEREEHGLYSDPVAVDGDDLRTGEGEIRAHKLAVLSIRKGEQCRSRFR